MQWKIEIEANSAEEAAKLLSTVSSFFDKAIISIDYRDLNGHFKSTNISIDLDLGKEKS